MTPYTRSGVGISAAGARLNHEMATLREKAPAEIVPVERESDYALPAVRARLRRDFAGVRMSRLEGDWLATNNPIDQSIRWDLRRLRARSRDLAMNTPQGKHYRNLLTTNVIGPNGIRMRAQNVVGSEDAETLTLDLQNNRKIERAWKRWTEGPVSIDGKMDWIDFNGLALKTVATDGECFIRIWRNFDGPDRLALQIIDSDLVDEQYNREPGADGNEIRMGIEVNAFGRPVAYYVQKPRPYYAYGTSMPMDRQRIPADEIIHLYVIERANQTRGIPWFAPVMLRVKMLDSYAEAALVGARVGASKMGFIQAKDGSAVTVPDPTDGSDPRAPMIMEGNPGTIEQLDQGWEFKEWDPSYPHAAFADFVKAMSRDVWSGVGVSYNAGANDLEGVNYSSMRSGLLIERDSWKALQRWWIGKLVRPVGCREWLNLALLSGSLLLPSRLYTEWDDIAWIPRGWPWVDPEKDANAAVIQINNGLTSRTRELAEQGEDLEEVLREIAAETKLAKDLGVELAPADAALLKAKADQKQQDENSDSPPAKPKPPAK